MSLNNDLNHLLDERTRRFLEQDSQRMLIGAHWRDARDGGRLEVTNPADEQSLGSVAAAGEADVDDAVAAARAALEDGPWARARPNGRERLLLKLADLMERDARVLAQLDSVDNGKSAQIAEAVDVTLAIAFFRYMAGWATKIEGGTHEVSALMAAPEAEFSAFTRREPVGVVAAIVPWNFPLLMAAWKLAPALAAGCTVVLKPAEQTPLSALYLGQLIQEAGFPAGVVNVITGDGPGTGAPLTRHPGINKISFTGSTEVGQMIGRAAMDNMARVTLELGGKSPMIVLDDYDPEQAAQGAAQAIFFNHGQVCSAGSRLDVHKSRYDQVVEGLARLADEITLGHGLDPDNQMGPLVSREQMERVLGYIDSGREQGAQVATRGGGAPERGYFVRPTVFAGTDDALRVAREEIFGPVVVALPYDDIEEVARRANDSAYGLAASVWSNDLSRVHRLIPRLKAGSVWVNCHNMLDPAMPFGGYKMSGFGRDMGRDSLNAYLETKSVVMAL
ncbi:aldehyde dehydrogenase family protein [Alloalcanivorax profundimaris]|uniref:aldehyde dehydrogenase family protein n=1 Tax=Alloalcanivorax profundimaris TaxID=2735259 RepID=UPI0018892CF4|nr:aldehyde dehydrogenase family protein [Alloalcanivorax profundimaris]MBF1801200.1 aldehyde dehydrogenase family protein [Alloalcanivorax profundimaris]